MTIITRDAVDSPFVQMKLLKLNRRMMKLECSCNNYKIVWIFQNFSQCEMEWWIKNKCKQISKFKFSTFNEIGVNRGVLNFFKKFYLYYRIIESSFKISTAKRNHLLKCGLQKNSIIFNLLHILNCWKK